MKRKLKLNKKTIKNLKLRLRKPSDRRVAPMLDQPLDPSNGMSC